MAGGMMLLGWTAEQWAKAAAWYTRSVGPLPRADFDGALRVQHAWRTERTDEPVVGVIAGITERLDHAWARDAWLESVAKLSAHFSPRGLVG